MALRVVGGYTRSRALPHTILTEWGRVADASLQNGAHDVKVAEGYSVDSTTQSRIYADAYVVVDDAADDAWSILGMETVAFDTTTWVQELERQTRVQEVCGKQLLILSYSASVYLNLRPASERDPRLHIEILLQPCSDDPCLLLSEHGVRKWPGMCLAMFETCGEKDKRIFTIVTACLEAVPCDTESKEVILGRGYAAAAVGGIALGIVAPYAVLGMVSSLGFSSSGIVSGSTAAGMMSAEALASGGTIAAGGTVATLQSIGAAGLGAAATAGSMTAGAAAGSAAAGSVGSLANHQTEAPEEEVPGRWTVVTEEWFAHKCSLYRFVSLCAARAFFDKKWKCARILVNPFGQEVMSGVFVTNLNGALDNVRSSWQEQLSS